jgi:hydroxyacylglutathione hydrolase
VPQTTLGYEKRFNWAFRETDESEFVRSVLADQPEPPRYFAQMKRINLAGPPLLGGIRRPARLAAETLPAVLQQGGTVVDTRPAREFALAAVPGTINIPINRAFTTWAGSLLPYGQDLHLIVEDSRAHNIEELVKDLAGIGLDRIAGYFGSDTVEAWQTLNGNVQTIPTLTSAEVSRQLRDDHLLLLDVRSGEEWRKGHLPESLNLPLGALDQRLNDIPRDRPVVVHCQSGARAAIAASLLKARGYADVRLFPGGFAEWQAAGLAQVTSR